MLLGTLWDANWSINNVADDCLEISENNLKIAIMQYNAMHAKSYR